MRNSSQKFWIYPEIQGNAISVVELVLMRHFFLNILRIELLEMVSAELCLWNFSNHYFRSLLTYFVLPFAIPSFFCYLFLLLLSILNISSPHKKTLPKFINHTHNNHLHPQPSNCSLTTPSPCLVS